MNVLKHYNFLKYYAMKKYEYYTPTVSIEDMEQELKSAGKKGWQFCNLVVMQKMMPPQRVIGGMNAPQMITEFLLIFIREDNKSEN
jgi:hypothetical protein